MSAVATEPREVAKRKTHGRPSQQPAEPYGRIELQASPEWIEQLDAAADAVGLSRSAYIRQACIERMARDRKTLRDED